MFEVLGLAEFVSKTNAWLDAIEQQCADVARGLAVESFNTMLRISPQFSGDFVANWNVSVDAPDTGFQPYRANRDARAAPFIGGDPEAQAEARARNAGKAGDFRLGQTIYITNASHHDTYYAQMIEDNIIRFRPGNAGAVIANTVQIMVSKAQDLSPGGAERLAQERF